MDEESSNLNLARGIEGNQANVGLGESLGALGDLLQDLRAIVAAEHGELPHSPVAVVLVASGDSTEADGVGAGDVGVLGLRELEAGGPGIADHVVHLKIEKIDEKRDVSKMWVQMLNTVRK